MPIDIQTFKRIDYQDLSSIKGKILEFLKKEKDKAFEYTEIAEAVSESPRSVNANLSLLKEEGRVLHKRPYWAHNPNYSPFTSQTNRTVSKDRFYNHSPKLLAKILDVSDKIINGGIHYSLSIREVATKYGVTKSTIIDACTRRLKLNTQQFKELVSDKKKLADFLIDRFPSYESNIRERLKLITTKEKDESGIKSYTEFQLSEKVIDSNDEVKIKMIDTCFKYGVATLSTKDRHIFPKDKHPFLLQIDGKLKRKHVASLKIAMKDFFDNHPELEEKEYIIIKVIKPLEEYKLIY